MIKLVGFYISAIAIFGAPPMAIADSSAVNATYRLGPQDQLFVRVYDFRKSSGEAYPWPALTGEFTINYQGDVSMPVIGQVRAAGLTTAELSTSIGTALKQKVGLAETPEASVEVRKYRPFYVLGSVQRPGKFEYQPGLTVLQALSYAEGLARATDINGVRREIATERGDLRAYEAERITLEARQARLMAEINGARSVTYPEFLMSHSDDKRVVETIRQENLLFSSRKNAFDSEINVVNQNKNILQQEINSLASKKTSLLRQIDINKKQLEVVTGLLNKGMTDKPRQIAAEQTEASYESSLLDVEVAALRAQQDLSRADRDIIEIQTRFRKSALDDEAEVREKLDIQAERVRTASMALHEAEQRSPGFGDEEDPVPVYELTHTGPQGSVTRSVSEADIVEPEDVLRVTLSKPNQIGSN